MLQTNPTCVDLILTNILQRFSNTCVVETGLSHFYLMSITIMRKNCKKFQTNLMSYRRIQGTLTNTLSNENLVNNDNNFQRFCNLSLKTSNKHAPCKRKQTRGNQLFFLGKKY